MSFPVWIEVVCCRCAANGPGCFSYAGIPRRDLGKAALDNEWKLIEDNDGDPDWYCPVCAKGVMH